MGTYPTSPRTAFLDWCQTHERVFIDHAAALGLTPAMAAAFKTATEAAVAKVLDQEAAKQAALVATQAAQGALDALDTAAGDIVRTIKAVAQNAPDPNLIYNLAQIPPPARPAPAPPPAQPTDLCVTLGTTDGALRLSWKAANPPGTSGTAYIIRRRLPGEGGFAYVGVSGKKTFVDDTFIAGPECVQYTVQGQRADSSGPVSPIFTVSFGKLPGKSATVVASVTPNGPLLATKSATPGMWNVEIPAPSGSGAFAGGRR